MRHTDEEIAARGRTVKKMLAVMSEQGDKNLLCPACLITEAMASLAMFVTLGPNGREPIANIETLLEWVREEYEAMLEDQVPDGPLH